MHCASKNSAVEEKKDRCYLHDNNKRDAEHEFEMVGLMANEDHTKEHCRGATEYGGQHQCAFGYAKLYVVFAGNYFVVDAKYD